MSAWKHLRYFVAVHKHILSQGGVRLWLWFQKQGCKCHRCLCFHSHLAISIPERFTAARHGWSMHEPSQRP